MLAMTLPAEAERSNAVAVPADPSALCDAAAAQASRETGVPLAVLRAISLTETGRRRNGEHRPWPWTVNMEGAGKWFDTPDEALSYVFRHHQRGARSYDVGCFQLNYRWHGQHFASIERMFDPLENARYAARFLSDLHGELGDWSRAAGAYHSRTPKYANRYRARFDRILAQVSDQPVPIASEEAIIAAAEPAKPAALPSESVAPAGTPPPRENRFPLLQATAGTIGMGSLVPLADAPSRRLIEPGGNRSLAAPKEPG